VRRMKQMNETTLLLARWITGAVWLVALASFFLPPSPLHTAGQLLFWGMLIAHAVECLLFRRTLLATGKPPAGQFLRIMVFGVVHYWTIVPPQPAD